MWKGNKIIRTCQRLNEQGHAHELTFSCYQCRAFLCKERTCQWLAQAINAAKDKHHFPLWAYVFMPTHVHLLISPQRDDYSVSRILQAIKQPVAMKAIAFLKQENPEGLKQLATGQSTRPHRFWQNGGGFDRNITQTETMIKAIRYIHRNPVRKGYVDSEVDWLYSSAADWQCLRQGPVVVDINDWPV